MLQLADYYFMEVFSGVYALSKGISATLIALIVSLQPILTSFLAKIYLNETLTKFQWIGIILGFSGASIIVISDLIGDLSLIAFFAGIIGLISSSLAIIWQKKIGSNLSLSGNNFLQALSASVFHLLLAICFENFLINFSDDFLFAMSWQIFAVSLGAFLILMWLLENNKANINFILFSSSCFRFTSLFNIKRKIYFCRLPGSIFILSWSIHSFKISK